jgi:hypothetical protein
VDVGVPGIEKQRVTTPEIRLVPAMSPQSAAEYAYQHVEDLRGGSNVSHGAHPPHGSVACRGANARDAGRLSVGVRYHDPALAGLDDDEALAGEGELERLT